LRPLAARYCTYLLNNNNNNNTTPKPVYSVVESGSTRRQRIYNKQARYKNLKKKQKTRILIDVEISADRNVVQNEAEIS